MEGAGKMTDYERQRLENIKRNEEMLAAFNIRSRLNDLTAAKRQRAQSKSNKHIPVKKPKVETPVVLRRSLRARGVRPDATMAGGLTDNEILTKSPVNLSSLPEPFAMKDAYTGADGLDQKFIETIINQCSDEVETSDGNGVHSVSGDILKKSEDLETMKFGKGFKGAGKVESLQLMSENVARLVQGRIMDVKFFPTTNMHMVVVGNRFGHIGFWNVSGEEEDGNGIYLYRPHPSPISGIIIDPFSMSKMYTSCFDGFIRLMDVEREMFDMVYSSEYSVYSMSLGLHSMKALYFGEGKGGINAWDVRAGKSFLSCDLHEYKINTIDFNSQNEHVMATSSTDGTACIWDLRHLSNKKPTPLVTVNHGRSVQSAYFSPTGKALATTCLADNVGLLTGANYENTSMVYHYNQTGRWLSTFRGIWGWDDSSIFIGNMSRGVDIVSVDKKKIVATLESDYMTAVPCRFHAHPCNVGMLASATSGGQVYIWT